MMRLKSLVVRAQGCQKVRRKKLSTTPAETLHIDTDREKHYYGKESLGNHHWHDFEIGMSRVIDTCDWWDKMRDSG